jgi:hypothetical protein
MRKADTDGIIAKKTWDVWKLGIVILAALLRTYRIEALTEFLGDQGRTMLIMRDFIERGVVPLAGPTTLSGHHVGPMFYYLLAPGYVIFDGSPVGVSLWMAIFGVVAVWVLYETAKNMFGLFPARAVSLLWVVSPHLIASDRVIWEPNMVPLFVLLSVYLLYRAHTMWFRGVWVALGGALGVLVQLHYPNMFFVALLGLYLVGSLLLRLRKFREVVAAGSWWLAGFIAVLLPFLWYEYTVGFGDLRGIATVMASGGGAFVGKRVMAELWLEYAFRVFGRALPFMSRITAAILVCLWVGFTMSRPTKKNILLTVWFFAGLTPMARFSWVVYDHYLFFLVPVPFLMIASVLSAVRQRAHCYVAVCIIGVSVALQLSKTDLLGPGRNDIARVSTAVERIRDVVNTSRFSFTLIRSDSFSDLHYRYFMKRIGLRPEPITDAYSDLVLVCDQSDCPTPKTLMKEEEVQVLCFEEYCQGLYPKIPLFREWEYLTYREVNSSREIGGRIYVFKRRPKGNTLRGLDDEYLVQ